MDGVDEVDDVAVVVVVVVVVDFFELPHPAATSAITEVSTIAPNQRELKSHTPLTGVDRTVLLTDLLKPDQGRVPSHTGRNLSNQANSPQIRSTSVVAFLRIVGKHRWRSEAQSGVATLLERATARPGVLGGGATH